MYKKCVEKYIYLLGERNGNIPGHFLELAQSKELCAEGGPNATKITPARRLAIPQGANNHTHSPVSGTVDHIDR
jgi:hypothetical protein